jgi:phospholipid/cholesterol/gamma-HCH transport system substrate-binding protein
MEGQQEKFKVRLGMMVAGGFALFIIAIFYIGRQKHLFNPVFKISTKLRNVSGLQIGNNVRYSGINVGTVDNIQIINDSTVKIDLMIDKDVQRFIHPDCQILIGSEGIIGDRVVNISQGEGNDAPIQEGHLLSSVEPVETDEILSGLKITVENAEIVSGQLAEMLYSINHGSGTLSKLLRDTSIAEDIGETIVNLKKSTKGLNENMEAAKNNFLLKGYFRKKEKAKEQQQKKQEKENNNK